MGDVANGELFCARVETSVAISLAWSDYGGDTLLLNYIHLSAIGGDIAPIDMSDGRAGASESPLSNSTNILKFEFRHT